MAIVLQDERNHNYLSDIVSEEIKVVHFNILLASMLIRPQVICVSRIKRLTVKNILELARSNRNIN